MIQVDSAPAETAAAVKCDLASEVLRSFGTLRFAATGWSMLPTIWPGDTLVVERINLDQVQVGEVVLVGRDSRLCAHRLVSKAEGSRNSQELAPRFTAPHFITPHFVTPYFVTQGDAMSAPDRPVSESELLGRVTSVIRAGKEIVLPAELSLAAKLIAKIVRHSDLAARALVYLHDVIESPRESVLPCQG